MEDSTDFSYSFTCFYYPAELLDILTSAVMVGSLLVLLAEGIYSTIWECRLRSHSPTSDDLLKRRLTGTVFEPNLPFSVSPSPLSQQQQHQTPAETTIPTVSAAIPQRAASQYVYGFSRGNRIIPQTYAMKWNQLILAQSHNPDGGQQFCRQSQQLQPQLTSSSTHQFGQQQNQPISLFLDMTGSTGGIRSPSKSNHPPSDVV